MKVFSQSLQENVEVFKGRGQTNDTHFLYSYVDKATVSFSSSSDSIAIKSGKVRILWIEKDVAEFSFELCAQDDYYIWHGKYRGAIE